MRRDAPCCGDLPFTRSISARGGGAAHQDAVRPADRPPLTPLRLVPPASRRPRSRQRSPMRLASDNGASVCTPKRAKIIANQILNDGGIGSIQNDYLGRQDRLRKSRKLAILQPRTVRQRRCGISSSTRLYTMIVGTLPRRVLKSGFAIRAPHYRRATRQT